MPSNLKDRLRFIQTIKKNESTAERAPGPAQKKGASISLDGWESAGYQTVKKEIDVRVTAAVPAVFPVALPIVIPDTARCIWQDGARNITARDLLFFDLETTGLSGGAGTVAFLAAFGRFCPASRGEALPGKAQTQTGVLRVTQYLLLDYPGESDFLEAVLKEFSSNALVVSYNGKSFDSQVLKTRCLMNGIQPPQYLHADLLHPARRLWKNILENCSQSTIEEKVLGMERAGDIPGSQAPEIWFDFLRGGGTQALMGICEHNKKDIEGLASIFALMVCIAGDPLTHAKKKLIDSESLALRWREVTRSHGFPRGAGLEKKGEALLRFAAANGGEKAALARAFDTLRSNQKEEGRALLLEIANANTCADIQSRVLRALAIDSERRHADLETALAFTHRALELPLPDSLKREFENRRNRLVRKLELREKA